MPQLTQQQIAAGKLAADSLHARINQIYQHDNIVFGHHDSLAYGRSHNGWRGTSPTSTDGLDFNIDQSDIAYALTNNAAGLYGWDLMGLEDITNADTINLTISSAKLRNEIPVKDVIAWIKKVHYSGGINTVCWHMKNPSNLGDYNNLSNKKTLKEAVTPNTTANRNITKWINAAANFFTSLIDEDGNPIPILFRPFHEVTNFSAFFWWNQIDSTNSTPTHYKLLWQNTIMQLYNKGVQNLVNVFCIQDFFLDYQGNFFQKILDCIPDTNLYDVIGFDAYQRLNTRQHKINHPNANVLFANNDGITPDPNFNRTNFITRVRQQLDAVNALAVQLNKIPALTEIGADYFYDDSSWWTNTLQQIIANKHLAYLMTWRNPAYHQNDASTYYAPYYNPTGLDISDMDINYVHNFVAFYTNNTINTNRVLFLNELIDV